MSATKALHNAALKMLRNRGITAIEVTSFEEETVSGGYCETCYYEETLVDITYITETGVVKVYEFSGSFAELVKALDN